jgi:hypothetical protein
LNNYGYNLGKDYQGFLTGNNVKGDYKANTVNPMMETLAGAKAGFGFGGDYGPQIGNFIGGFFK